ncbi:MAG: hypothetical protein LUI09_06230 [Prevotellaceae bacterium]|nr:hypothetical protein [Prevotellaceae bacterium]
MKASHTIFIVLLCTLPLSCKRASVPHDYTQSRQEAMIYPDYRDVTVPCNIAPLTFHIDSEAEESVCRLTDGETEIVLSGPDICPKEKQWRQLKGTVTAEVFLKNQGRWTRMKPFSIVISPDSIDPYISYRLIAPSYVTYEDLTICQRCLETYEESVIYGNMINSNEKDGQCINCHAYQNYNPDRMQFHVRQAKGGTIISYDGKTERIDLVTGKTVSAGVYPAWHPTEKLIAYSTNHTGQSFHTNDVQKIEVQDTYSDLMLYDIDKHEVLPLEKDTNNLDCFPHWSPDGKWLYYCSAHYERADTTEGVSKEFDMIVNYQQVRYSLYRRPFDLKTRSFGERELVYDAAADSMSATLPRVSPDGRWLMFTMGRFGVFHIWHTDADLYLMNLKTKEVRPMKELNSDNVESYHTWSSNGRWVIFSSRRTDGNYTRPFIAHIDAEGRGTKPFELPSKYPEYHRELLRSYNIPEFMKGPVKVRPQEFAAVVNNDSIKAK